MIPVFVLLLLLCGSGVMLGGATLVNAIFTVPDRPRWQRILAICGGIASGIGFSVLMHVRGTTLHHHQVDPAAIPGHVLRSAPFAGEPLMLRQTLWEWRLWAMLMFWVFVFLVWRLGAAAELPRPLHIWRHLRQTTAPRWYRLTLLGIFISELLFIGLAVTDTMTYWRTTRPIMAAMTQREYPPESVAAIIRDSSAPRVWVHIMPFCGINETALLLEARDSRWFIKETKIIGGMPFC